MQPEPASDSLRQIQALYEEALGLAAADRPGFVEQACAGNAALRDEIQSLLIAHERGAGFLEVPALEVAADLYSERRPSLIGQTIGRYRILALAGAGGMGVVYRALDPRLNREVAIKILPLRHGDDSVALARFQREAVSVAALSHPNILSLYDFDSAGDTYFAVMEFLEGNTLSNRLSRKPMHWREAVEIAVSVADGLAAAHKKGIVHRDIKPENIYLTGDGQVKILDFGIACVPSGLPKTPYSGTTLPGLAVGTVGYMAPEQLRGEGVDQAADLFSLGCVLFEMVTGRQPFERATLPDRIAAILTAEPSAMSNSVLDVPLELEAVVQRCLRKPPAERFHSAPELAVALRSIMQSPAGVETPASRHRSAWPWLWIPVAILAIAAAALLWPSFHAAFGETDSLAILPIANLSGDPDLEYLTDGITESLINSMSAVPKLKVIGRTTAFQFKGQSVDAQKAGRQLNVRRVFTGRLDREAGSIGVQVDLVNVADGSELWGYHYKQNFSDLVILPEAISSRISEKLQLRLDQSGQKRLSRGRTENQEAFRLYLTGRYYWNQRNQGRRGVVEKAIGFFRGAIEKDPLYALAYVGLAEAYATLPGFSDVSTEEGDLKGKAAARKALEIDDTVSEAYVALASIAEDEWDWDEAGTAFRRALQLNPGYATAHQWYGSYLELTGHVKEGLVETERAYELDPLSPIINSGLAALLYDDHQYDRSIAQSRKTLELKPDFGLAYVHIALALLAQGKNRETVLELERARAVLPGLPVTGLSGYAQAQSGNRQAALKLIQDVANPANRYRGTAWDLMVLHLGLGDKDRAFYYLNEACDHRFPLVTRLKVDPFFATLRSDPRYMSLLRRMNLRP